MKPNQALGRWRLTINGLVQGVGFRPFLYNLASSIGVSGWVRNNFAGVEVEVQGAGAQLEKFRSALQTKLPPTAVIDQINIAQDSTAHCGDRLYDFNQRYGSSFRFTIARSGDL